MKKIIILGLIVGLVFLVGCNDWNNDDKDVFCRSIGYTHSTYYTYDFGDYRFICIKNECGTMSVLNIVFEDKEDALNYRLSYNCLKLNKEVKKCQE